MDALKDVLKRTLPLITILVLATAGINAQQSREETQIHIPMPTGGSSAQQSYFYENFLMETTAAGYMVTDTPKDSDYILNLRIKPNMVTYDDGGTEPAPADEPQYIMEILLTKTEDGSEIVQLEFMFTELEEMAHLNLVLLYQAMANIPLTKTLGIVEDDHWRNKWLYILLSVDFNVPVYAPHTEEYPVSVTDSGGKTSTSNFPVSPLIPFAPGLTAGIELQFLNWMSAQASLSVMLGNVEGINYNHNLVGTFDVSLKFPLKPAKHYMIEPYAGVSLPLALMGTKLPQIGAQGGVQIATKAGNMGGFFINLRGEYDFGTVTTSAPNPPVNTKIDWTRFSFGIGAGYKMGFMNRKQR